MKPSARLVAIVALSVCPILSWAQFDNHGLASASISGRVLLESNRPPAERIRVGLRSLTGGSMGIAFTGWQGEFSFESVPAGTYVVEIEEPDYAPMQESVNVEFGSRSMLLYLKRQGSAVPGGAGYVVPVRELSIPAKAHNAFREGIERLEQDDVPGGAAQFRRAIAAFPSYYEAHYQLGLAELRLGLQANAEQSFRKSVELSEGRYFSSQMALGALLCEQGRFAEAETAIRQALEQRNNSWLGQFYLARVLLGLGQLEEAAESAHEVILRNASLPEVYLVLADIHFRQNKQEALLNDLDEYLRLAPDTANSLEAKAIREKVWHALSIRNSLHP